MESDMTEEASQMEINISHLNSENQIVLNDLRLLELVYLYPFLFSKRVRPQQDPDYEDWAWEQITAAFNVSYADVPLSTPFSVEELQWRFDILRPLVSTLSKAKGQIPDVLWDIIVKIHQMMQDKTPCKQRAMPSVQRYILEQIPLVEKLSLEQRRRLEVDVLNAIFDEEIKLRSIIKMGKKENALVQREYEEFLKVIRVRELPPSPVDRTESNTDSSKPSSSSNIITSCHSDLVISSVSSASEQLQQSMREESSTVTETDPRTQLEPKVEPDPEPEAIIPLVQIKEEPPEVPETEIMPNISNNIEQTRYVPLKSAKYYVQPVKVRLKRIDPFTFWSPKKKKKKLSST